MDYKAKMHKVLEKQTKAAEAFYAKSEVEARHRLSLELLCQRGLCTRSLSQGWLTYVMAVDGFTYRFKAVVANEGRGA